MRGLALQSLKYWDKYNCHNQSLWLGINYSDRLYGTAIASLFDKIPKLTILLDHGDQEKTPHAGERVSLSPICFIRLMVRTLAAPS